MPKFNELVSMLVTFSLVTLAWIFFRAESISCWRIFLEILNWNLSGDVMFVKFAFFFVIIMLGVDWLSRTWEIPSRWLSPKMLPIRWSVYEAVMIFKNLQNGSSFIYFQF